MNKITSHTAQDIDRILENMRVMLENNASQSLQSFVAVLNKGRPLIVHNLASTVEEKERDLKTQRDLAERSRKTLLESNRMEEALKHCQEKRETEHISLENRLAELKSQFDLEIQSLRAMAKTHEQQAQEEASQIQLKSEKKMENLCTSLEGLKIRYNSLQGNAHETENQLLSLFHRREEELDCLLEEHTKEVQNKEKQIEGLLDTVRDEESQLVNLEEHFHVVDRNLRSMNEEEEAFEKVRSMEEAAYRTLNNAATQFQGILRGRKVRTEVAKAKAKPKEKKRKGKQKKKSDKKNLKKR